MLGGSVKHAANNTLQGTRGTAASCFAGLVSQGPGPKQSRHYASMAVDGDDLHILSRSGDQRAASAHNGNLITFHTVMGFRDLVY